MITLATIASDILHSGVRLGDYQRGLLETLAEGRQPCWSGANLRGKASKWGSSYARSRERVLNLLAAETWRQARCHINRRADRARNGRIIVELHP